MRETIIFNIRKFEKINIDVFQQEHSVTVNFILIIVQTTRVK